MFEKYKDIVTVDELCEMLNISRNLAYRLLKAKKVQGIRVGRAHRIPKTNIIDYIKNFDE